LAREPSTASNAPQRPATGARPQGIDAAVRSSSEDEVSSGEASSSGILLASDAGDQILLRALRKRPQIKALLDHALAKHWEGNTYIVVFEKGSLWIDMFSEKRPVLAEALSQEMNAPVKVEVRTEGGVFRAEKSEMGSGPVLPSDPVVQQAVEILNARVQEVKKI